MLILKNKYDKNKSTYQCDMCKKNMKSADRISIRTAENFGSYIKKWDLCKSCFNRLERAVDNYYEKKLKKSTKCS